METLKIERERHYQYYDIRDEWWDNGIPNMEPVLMSKLAYSKQGDWIGSSTFAYRLVHNFGIERFEKTKDDHCVCSIGFSPKRSKWYGWSHRAIYGFTIGSTCKEGDCGYMPDSFSEIGRTCDQRKGDTCIARAYYLSEAVNPDEPLGEIKTKGPARGKTHCTVENCIFEVGRGEWVAKTMEDVKLMAIDFAGGVS